MTNRTAGSQSSATHSSTHSSGNPTVTDRVSETTTRVGETAKDEASRVAAEAKFEARKMFDQASAELNSQAVVQQDRATHGLRTVAGQLQAMANGTPQPGMAMDLMQEAAQRVQSMASWLEARDPSSVLHEVKSFARRRPGLFIAVAAGAGIVAGRLIKAMTDTSREQSTTVAPLGNSTYATAGVATGSAYVPVDETTVTTPAPVLGDSVTGDSTLGDSVIGGPSSDPLFDATKHDTRIDPSGDEIEGNRI